jgi:hypothetical protein
MSDATVTLGLNAAELYNDLNGAISRFQQGMNRMQQSTGPARQGVDHLTGAHDRLFTSSHRVANRVGALTSSLASGANAADVMGVAIEGLGRSLNLPLGILAALAATGILVQQIYKTQSEIEKLHSEIAKIGEGHINPRFESLETLKTRAEEAKKKLEELQKAHDGFLASAIRGFGSIGATSKEDTKDQGFESDTRKLRQQVKRAREGEVEKGTEGVENAETKFSVGDLAAKDKEIDQKRHEAVTASQATEKDAKGNDRFVYDAKARAQAVDNANRQAAVDHAEVQLKREALQREAALEERITQIKSGGLHVDQAIAQAKLDAAKATLEAANVEGKPKAQAGVNAAQLEVEEANRKQAALDREVAQEEELTAIKASGLNVDERSAEAKLKYAKAALDAAKADDVPKATAAVHAAAAEIEVIARNRAKTQRLATEETAELQAQLKGYDELAGILRDEASIHEQILEAMKNGDTVLADQLDKQRAIKNEIAKQKAEGAKNDKEKENNARNERRDERHENKREKELKNELSNTSDPDKRADIKDELADIQQKRDDRAQKHVQEQAAAEAAAQKEAQDRATEQKANADKQETDRAAGEKTQDESEVQKFGRVLNPDERARQKSVDDEAARQKGSQDENNKRQQDFQDQGEAGRRGISVEQLHNERDIKSRQNQAEQGAQDASPKAASDELKSAGTELKAAADALKKAVTNQ